MSTKCYASNLFQSISASSSGNMSTGTTQYNLLMGGSASWTTTRSDVQGKITEAGILKNLAVLLNGTAGAGKSYTFTVENNGASTLLSCSISGTSATSCSDLVNTPSVSVNDLVNIMKVPAGTPTARAAKWTVAFLSDDMYSSIYFGAMPAASWDLSNTTDFVPYGTTGSSTVSTGNYIGLQMIIPTSGYLMTSSYTLDAAPGVGNSVTLTFTKNDSTTAHSVTISDNNTTGSLTSPIYLIPGDCISIRTSATGTPATTAVRFGWTFRADFAGEFIVPFTSQTAASTATQYNFGGNSTGSWNSTESNRLAIVQAFKAKKIYISLDSNPEIGTAVTIGVQQNQTGTSLGASIDETINIINKTFYVDFAAGDRMDIKSVPFMTTVGHVVQASVLGYTNLLPNNSQIFGATIKGATIN